MTSLIDQLRSRAITLIRSATASSMLRTSMSGTIVSLCQNLQSLILAAFDGDFTRKGTARRQACRRDQYARASSTRPMARRSAITSSRPGMDDSTVIRKKSAQPTRGTSHAAIGPRNTRPTADSEDSSAYCVAEKRTLHSDVTRTTNAVLPSPLKKYSADTTVAITTTSGPLYTSQM